MEELREQHLLSDLLTIAKLARSSFYYHRAQLCNKDKYADLKKRRFKAAGPHKRCLTDITEFKVGDNKLYLSSILDCYNNEIISYTLSRRPTYDLVSQMLDHALDKTKYKRHKKLMLHSDQGWHYQMKPFKKTLKKHQIKQSMSRKGNCLDNALREGFFGTLKCETIYLEKPISILQP